MARRALKLAAVAATTGLVGLSVGSALGRWRVLPITATGAQVQVDDGSLAFVVPVPAKALREGDLIFFAGAGDKGSIRKVVRINDSWQNEVLVDRRDKGTESAKLSATVGRVSRVIPYGGWVFRLLVGPIQAVLMMVGGLLMVVLSQIRRPGVQSSGAPPGQSGPARRRFGVPLRGRRAIDPVVPNLQVAHSATAVEPAAVVQARTEPCVPPPPGDRALLVRGWPIGVGLGTALLLVLYVTT